MEFIIGIQPGHDAALRSAKPLAYGGILAAILPTLPVSQIFFVLFNYRHRIIRAAAIHYNVFQVWVALAENRIDAFFQILSLVERGSDNRKDRQILRLVCIGKTKSPVARNRLCSMGFTRLHMRAIIKGRSCKRGRRRPGTIQLCFALRVW